MKFFFSGSSVIDLRACLLFALILFSLVGFSQDRYRLNLNQIIELAQSDAPDVLLAETRYKNNYWLYQSFLSNYKPQIDLSSTLPNLNRSIEAITLPDGTDKFIERSLLRTNFNIALRQNIVPTGGEIFASTRLERIDILKTDGPSKAYLSTPISIGFIQPLFAYNDLRWNRSIQPLYFEEARRAYSEEKEALAYNGTLLFFDVLTAQLDLEAARLEKVNADTLLRVGQGRYDVGKIAEDELLKLQLGVMRAEASLSSAQLELQSTTEVLRNFLGITSAVRFDLILPDELVDVVIDEQTALQWAEKHRSKTIEFQRRLMEADREIARAKGERFNINLIGTFGLTQTAGEFRDAYRSPLDQEQLIMGINLPIADWGKSKARMEIAKSNRELTMLNVELEKINFDREIIIKVQQFELIRQRVRIAKESYDAARKGSEITQNRYLIGKIGITDLNIAISEQENSRIAYIESLRSYWMAYYELRGLTLFDFLDRKPLIQDDPSVR